MSLSSRFLTLNSFVCFYFFASAFDRQGRLHGHFVALCTTLYFVVGGLQQQGAEVVPEAEPLFHCDVTVETEGENSSRCSGSACDSPAVTVRKAELLVDPYGLDTAQQNRPPSSGKASAITRVQISSENRNSRHQHSIYKAPVCDSTCQRQQHRDGAERRVGTPFVMSCNSDSRWQNAELLAQLYRWWMRSDRWITAHCPTDRQRAQTEQSDTHKHSFTDLQGCLRLSDSHLNWPESHRWKYSDIS